MRKIISTYLLRYLVSLFFSIPILFLSGLNISAASSSMPNGISIEEDRRIKPSPPVGVTVQLVNQALVVSWNPKGLEIITSYKIFRKAEGDEKFSLAGTVSADPQNELSRKNRYSFEDVSAVSHKRYIYTVAAVDHYGNESDPSAPVEWLPLNTK